MSEKYRANFLWPHKDGSAEEAAYEFANAETEEYRKKWWEILKDRMKPQPQPEARRER